MYWQRSPELRIVDAETVAMLRDHWERGWNSQDADVVVEPFSEQVTFSSPFVPRILGDPQRWEIRGRAAVRQYVVDSFERATPGIRYRCDRADAGTDAVVLTYTVLHPAGERPGVDLMRLDPEGRVVEWRCHYPFDD